MRCTYLFAVQCTHRPMRHYEAGIPMFDFNSQNRTQMILLMVAGTLLLMALIMTFTRQVIVALIVGLVAVLAVFASKAISSYRGTDNAPPDLPEHLDDMRPRQ